MDQVDEKVSRNYNNNHQTMSEEDEMDDLRRGPWTVEEDFILINYIAHHGEGRWNSLARCAGLKRTGKSCRLRWLNYLRPDVRRGNITLEEQLLILELHSRWGNRWSKIAQHLPGRTDNEIKNYWRTRVQKHAKQLKCDVNSKQFKDTMRYLWMPRLVERIQAAGNSGGTTVASSSTNGSYQLNNQSGSNTHIDMGWSAHEYMLAHGQVNSYGDINSQINSYASENSSAGASSDSFGTPGSELREGYNNNNYYYYPVVNNNQVFNGDLSSSNNPSIGDYYFNQGLDHHMMDPEQSSQWMDGGDVSDNLWNNVDDMWFLDQQFNNNV